MFKHTCALQTQSRQWRGGPRFRLHLLLPIGTRVCGAARAFAQLHGSRLAIQVTISRRQAEPQQVQGAAQVTKVCVYATTCCAQMRGWEAHHVCCMWHNARSRERTRPRWDSPAPAAAAPPVSDAIAAMQVSWGPGLNAGRSAVQTSADARVLCAPAGHRGHTAAATAATSDAGAADLRCAARYVGCSTAAAGSSRGASCERAALAQ